MSSRKDDDDDRYSTGYSQDGAGMTADMDVPSRPPPQTSPKKHRHHRTKVPAAHQEDNTHDPEDDDGSHVSAKSVKSDVSERTRNTRNLIRGTSFTPKAGNPYDDLPIRSPPASQARTPRSTTRPVPLGVDTTHYQEDRLRPPASGPSGRSDKDLDREYSRSPGGRTIHRESAERPPPSGPTRSRGSHGDTRSRGYGQSPTSPEQYSPANMTGSDQYGLRLPKVHMPFLADYTVPSASAKNPPQYEEISPRDKRPALPSGYAKPLHPNTAADYEDVRVESPRTQDRADPRRSSRGSYPERTGDDHRRDS